MAQISTVMVVCMDALDQPFKHTHTHKKTVHNLTQRTFLNLVLSIYLQQSSLLLKQHKFAQSPTETLYAVFSIISQLFITVFHHLLYATTFYCFSPRSQLCL